MKNYQDRINTLKHSIRSDLIELLESIYAISAIMEQLNNAIETITSPLSIHQIAIKRGSEETAKYLVYRYINTIDLTINFIYEHIKDILNLVKASKEKSKNISIDDILNALKKVQYLVAVEHKLIKIPPGYTLPKDEVLPDLTLNAHENSYKTLLKWVSDEFLKLTIEQSYDLYQLLKTMAYDIGSLAIKLINKIAILETIEATHNIQNLLESAKEQAQKNSEELSSEELSPEESMEELENIEEGETTEDEFDNEIDFDEESNDKEENDEH